MFKKLFFLLGSAFLLGACSEEKGKNPSKASEGLKPVIVMGTSADMPPFEFYKTHDSQIEIIGFDIAVAQEITRELGLELQIKDIDFSGLLPSLQAGRVDFVLASMSPTPERRKSVAFSIPYLTLPLSVMSKGAPSIRSDRDLSGKKIGVQLGSTHEQFMRTKAEKDSSIKVISLNKLGELVQELISERLDAILMETKTARSFQKIHPDLLVTVLENNTVEFAVAFPKGSPWVEKFNQAIKKIHSSGRLEELKAAWFSDYKNGR